MFDARLEPLQNKQEYSEYAREGELVYMGNKSMLARGYIRAHPVEFLRRCAIRMVRFWTGAGSEVNSGLVELHAVVTSVLGFIGLVVLLGKSRTTAFLFLWPLLIFPLPYYITHPDFRFRLLLDPALTILSAYAVCRLCVRTEKHFQERSVEPQVPRLPRISCRKLRLRSTPCGSL